MPKYLLVHLLGNWHDDDDDVGDGLLDFDDVHKLDLKEHTQEYLE